MEEIFITGNQPGQICDAIKQKLGCSVESIEGVSDLLVKNGFGKGSIKCIEVREGVSFLLFDLHLNNRLKLVFHNPDQGMALFLCLFEGDVSFLSPNTKPLTTFQTTITGGKDLKNSFDLDGNQKIKISIIIVDTQIFEIKKVHRIEFFNLLNAYFKKNPSQHFEHFGYLNVNLSEKIEFLNRSYDCDDINNLYREGQILVIISDYIQTFNNFENHLELPDFFSEKDVVKIYDLSKYIQEHISEKITIKDLSELSALNPHKLQRGFQFLFHCTVNQFVFQKKMEIALECLNCNELSISEIVDKIGWKSKSYFSKMFSKKYGMLPIEYRKTHRRLAKQVIREKIKLSSKR